MAGREISSQHFNPLIPMVLVLISIGYSIKAQAESMIPMADHELQSVSGGDAVQLTLRFRNNVDENNVPDMACG